MANKNYTSGIGKRLLEIADAAKELSRNKLDKKPHFVPLDFSIVELTLGHLISAQDLQKFYEYLLKNIKSAGYTTLSMTALNASNLTEIKKLLARGPIVIEYNRQIVGALFSSFKSVGQNLFTPILNKALGEFSPSGGFDIGHLVSDSLLAKSPLQLKLDEINGLLNVYEESKNRVKVDKYVANKLAVYYLTMYKTEANKVAVEAELRKKYGVTDIEKVINSTDALVSVINQKLKVGTFNNLKASNQAAFNMVQSKFNQAYDQLLERSRYGNTIIQTDLIKLISPTLSKLRANIVIIQDREENQKTYGSRIEAAIDREVRTQVIGTLLRSERFSPSFDEGVADLIREQLVTGSAKTKKSSKQVKLDVSLKPEKNVTRGKSTKVKAKPASLPRLRTPRGHFTSLTNLTTLIQSLLYETISKNMQRPNLRFQTGRFAKSVELKSLSQRNNTIQAFLTYMKYPYQTFEPGFAQGHKGYDPRRLIDQSVREIATKLVKARLQTIIV